MPMHPNAADKYIVLDLAAQSLYQLDGALQAVANDIEQHIGLQVEHLLAERARLLCRGPVNDHLPHCLPGGVLPIGLAIAPAHDGHVITGFYQAGHEKRPNVARPSQYDSAHVCLLECDP
jgi:hypothetical protein